MAKAVHTKTPKAQAERKRSGTARPRCPTWNESALAPLPAPALLAVRSSGTRRAGPAEPGTPWAIAERGNREVGNANLRSSPLIRSVKISADERWTLWMCGARILLLTCRVSDGGPRAFDLERGHSPAVHCTRFVRRFLLHLLSHARTKGATTHQPSGNALGNAITQQTFRALKARHRSEFSAFSAAACVGDTQTQGGASLCPGLMSSGAFGAKLDRVDHNAHCVRRFLSPNVLPVEGKVCASTQNQALNALVFLYREGLGQELEELGHHARQAAPQDSSGAHPE